MGLEELEGLDKEPPATSYGDNTILFKVKFVNSNKSFYTFVATKVPEGYWYVSGLFMGRDKLSWEALTGWIKKCAEWEVWHVTSYALLDHSVVGM